MIIEGRETVQAAAALRLGAACRPAALAASVLLFAWPQLSAAVRGVPASYSFVTILLTCALIAIVSSWRRFDAMPADAAPPRTSAAAIAAGVVAAGLIGLALYRWTHLMLWRPYAADMLIVIREATRRFLNGHSPYTIYRSYDTTWEMAMPYGPALWGPFVVPQLLRVDFRSVTIIGELFVPLWCGVTAVACASHGHLAAAASWLVLLAALVLALDVQQFTWIGHTPVYWPLILLFAVTMSRSRLVASAVVLGILLAARTTMLAIVPVFLMHVHRADRRRLPAVLIALAGTAALVLVPFAAWDYRGVWDSMVLSYPRVMKAAVWPELSRPGLVTIGVTEWLLEGHREWLVVPVQIAAMIAAYAAAGLALGRRHPALPWMGLALFVFSMTTLYPVHYLYYDVLLLLVSAAIAEAFAAGTMRAAMAAWALSFALAVMLIAIAVRAAASPFPRFSASRDASDASLQSGFAAPEHDGSREFAWIVGHEARLALPRSSASRADIVLSAQSAMDANQPPQRMTAILNGTLLADTAIAPGWGEIRIAAHPSVWWIGYNELRLVFSSTVSPRDAGGGDDDRPLALAVSTVSVEPPR